jgi:hypothetical protein
MRFAPTLTSLQVGIVVGASIVSFYLAVKIAREIFFAVNPNKRKRRK